MEQIKYYTNTFKENSSLPENKNTVRKALAGIFLSGVGMTLCALGHRCGLSHKVVRLALGSGLGTVGLVLMGHGAYKLRRPIQQKQPELPDTPDAIPEEVKKVLNRLFEGSNYKIEKLPQYEAVINNPPEPTSMTSPVMKAKTIDGRDAILIKVKTLLTKEQLVNAGIREAFHDENLETPIKERIIILWPYVSKEPLGWTEARRFQACVDYPEPSFFGWQITDSKTGQLYEDMQKEFDDAQKLFQTKQALDKNNITWEIAE